MSCPFCSSEDVELVSPWGGQLITSQMRCRACGSYFEAIRDREFGSIASPAGHGPTPNFPWTTSSADDR